MSQTKTKGLYRRQALLGLTAVMATTTAACAAAATDILAKCIAGSWRNADNAKRDAFRHPYEALTFWGLKPAMTVVEISPGAKGWWVEILAPYAHQTGGKYYASMPVLETPTMTEAQKTGALAAHQAFATEVADSAVYGKPGTFEFGLAKLDAFPEATADLVLVARAFHNWARTEGVTDKYLTAIARMLKKGGIFAVEQHRAQAGADPKAGTGYVPESYVIESCAKAGLVLDGRSEINANPKDNRDHPFGVWTLPPIRSSSPPIRSSSQAGKPDLTPEQRAAFDAIGESDRMTLRFKKA